MTALHLSPVTSVNQAPLAYWKERGFTTRDMDLVCQNLDRSLAARVQILPGLQFSIIVSNKVDETKQGHFPAIAHVIKELLQSWQGAPPVGELLFWLEDGQWSDYWSKQVPLIAYAKPVDDNYTFLMPDPSFLGSNGYEEERKEIDQVESALDWSQKKPAIFWRGVNSGLISLGEEWRKAPRVQLAMKSKLVNDPAILDAYFSHVIPVGQTNASDVLLFENLVRDKVPFNEFMKYRYLVDVDGETCAWRSLFLKLQTKSTVLKANSPMMQWYYRDIQPWVHYIPVASDFSDLMEIRESLERDPTKAKEIAERASAKMQEIQIAQEKQALIDLLKQILGCYRGLV